MPLRFSYILIFLILPSLSLAFVSEKVDSLDQRNCWLQKNEKTLRLASFSSNRFTRLVDRRDLLDNIQRAKNHLFELGLDYKIKSSSNYIYCSSSEVLLVIRGRDFLGREVCSKTNLYSGKLKSVGFIKDDEDYACDGYLPGEILIATDNAQALLKELKGLYKGDIERVKISGRVLMLKLNKKYFFKEDKFIDMIRSHPYIDSAELNWHLSFIGESYFWNKKAF